jgi:hypothetical protein
MEEALNFLEWLQGQSLESGKPSIPWTEPVYRIIYGDKDEEGKILAFFAKDDKHIHQAFVATEIVDK